MPYAYCSECGAEFWREPDERWKRLCWDCWKAKRAWEERRSHHFDWERATLQARINVLEHQLSRAQRQLDQANALFTLIRDHYRFLIFAVHPDRNSGREEAHELTRILLDLRPVIESGKLTAD